MRSKYWQRSESATNANQIIRDRRVIRSNSVQIHSKVIARQRHIWFRLSVHRDSQQQIIRHEGHQDKLKDTRRG